MVRWPGQEQVHGPKQILLPALTPQAPGSLPLSHTSDHDTHKHVGMVMIWISNVFQKQSDSLSCQFTASPEVRGSQGPNPLMCFSFNELLRGNRKKEGAYLKGLSP